jgi:hypothetical protein
MSFGFGAQATGGGFGTFGAPAAGGGFGAPAANTGAADGPSGANTGGAFGAATGGGFGAPAANTGGAFGAFGNTGGAFGAATGGGFGAKPAATGGGFGAFGAPAAGGGFGAPAANTGAAFGAFGNTGGTFGGGFGGGGSSFGGAAAAGAVQPAAAAPVPDWKTIQWKTKFEKLPELLQAKMKQHYNMVEDCKERNNEIRKLFERRRSEAAADAGHPGARGAEEDLEDARTERTASRLRHCLASLKASLQYDSFELQRQHEQAIRQKQVCHVMCVHLGVSGGHLRAHGLAALDSDAFSPLPLHALLSKYSTTPCVHIHTRARERVTCRESNLPR